MHAHCTCSSHSGVSLDTCYLHYLSSCGFPAHACPETCSALLPTQAELRSSRLLAPSVPAEATGLPTWHGWCLALWQLVPGLPASAESTDPAGLGHAALWAELAVQAAWGRCPGG